jgi:hypothetical protein
VQKGQRVILDVQQLVVLGMLSAAIHWVVARSGIGRPLWSRAHGWLASLLACAGCSGTWIGLGLAAVGLRPVSIWSAEAASPWWVVVTELCVASLLATFLTPVFEGVLLWGLERSAIVEEPPAPPPPTTPPSQHGYHPGLFKDTD